MAKSGAITELERWRRIKGKSVTGMAQEMAVSHTYVSLVEGNKMKPSARFRSAAARVLGVPEEVVFP